MIRLVAQAVRYLCFIGATCLAVAPAWGDVPYIVEVDSDLSPEEVLVIHRYSQIYTLQERPPASAIGLRRRADADIKNILGSLHTLAYYDPDVDIIVDTEMTPAVVTISVSSGPKFLLTEFHIVPATGDDDEIVAHDTEDLLEQGRCFLKQRFLRPIQTPSEGLWDDAEATDDDIIEWVKEDSNERHALDIPLNQIGIFVGDPAYPQTILDSEDLLVETVQCRGYPLARVVKHEILVDREEASVSVWLYVDSGPLAEFGDVRITGNKRVRDKYIRRKVSWSRGERFSPRQISCTFDALDRSGLFHLINIDWDEETDEHGLLPMHIHVSESKHRSVGVGFIYATEWGAGVVGEWEHRNFRGMGEEVTAKAELLRKHQTGLFRYRKPDFLCHGLDLVNTIELEREFTDSFDEQAATAAAQLHRKLTPCLHAWAGIALKYTVSDDSDNNRTFTLLQFPMQLRYSDADSLLDPTYGMTLNFNFTPTNQLLAPYLTYYTSTVDAAFYVPAWWDKCTTLASKLSYGSIIGAGRKDIPPPERMYAGTPLTLRGYRYLTVSPLDANNKPIGGRSLMVISLEMRRQINDEWGVVGFWEVGNVYDTVSPRFDQKQLQSAGIGVRYYTSVGPLRLDIAFPLDRRRPIDNALQVYFSIGQTF